jgi:anaerobic selenocysteine-containing dehydrogenase
MVEEHRTFCRLCEVGCGVVAEVEDGRVARVRPDHAHPVTKGYICNKGVLAAEMHRDPARLERPLRRGSDGRFSEQSWDAALGEIAERLRAIVDAHGPNSVALYLGNPNAFNATGSSVGGLFLRLLGSDRLFSAATQDCSNKFAIGDLLWNAAHLHLIPDLDSTHHLLVLGSNPRVSRSSFLSVPDPIARLQRIEERGGRVRFVDPRRIESRVGEIVQIRPDTDVYLLAAMLFEIDRTRGFDAAAAGRVRNLDALRRFLAQFPAQRVAPVVGIEAEKIAAMAREFAGAPSASVHVSTGVNMGRQGALAYWLAILLSQLTGNLDRRGGNVAATRAIPPRASELGIDARSFVQSPWGAYRLASGIHPGVLLRDMIRADQAPVRALIVVAGNPALSIGGGDELGEALASLELLVSIDLYRNATGDLAHHLLPATDWFEREDFNFFVQGTQTEPFVQWTGPVVPPGGARRGERAIFAELGERLGLPNYFPAGADMLGQLYDGALADHGLSLAALRAAPGGVAPLPASEPGGFLDRATRDGTIDGNPELLALSRERAVAIFDELAAESPAQLKLITRRTNHTLNSAMQSVRRHARGEVAPNPLYVSPSDATRLGLADGARVRVSNAHGAVETAVRVDDTLRAGVVAMTHGFGGTRAKGASEFEGVNANALAPHGPSSFDPVSGMAQLTGIPVEVARA